MNSAKGKNMDNKFVRIQFKLRTNDYLKDYDLKIGMPVKKNWELCNEEEKQKALKLWDPEKEVHAGIINLKTLERDAWIFQKLQEQTHTDVMSERRRKKITNLATIFWYNVIMPFRLRANVRHYMTNALCPKVPEGSSKDVAVKAQRHWIETYILVTSWIEEQIFKQSCLKNGNPAASSNYNWAATGNDWTFNKYRYNMCRNGGKGWNIPFVASLQIVEKLYQGKEKDLRLKKYGTLRKRVQILLKRSLEKENVKPVKKKTPVILKRTTPRKKGSGGSSSAIVAKKRKTVFYAWTHKDVLLLKSHKNFKKVMTEEISIEEGANSMSSLFPTWTKKRVYAKLHRLRWTYRVVQRKKKEMLEEEAVKGLMLLKKCPRCSCEYRGNLREHLDNCRWI